MRRRAEGRSLHYVVPGKAVHDTERVLRAYGSEPYPREGFAYWGGSRTKSGFEVKSVIAPRLDANFAGVRISAESNSRVVQALCEYSIVELAQVHSHPGGWVDHSRGDDLMAPFKVEGLVSIVVPDFCRRGMLPIEICGVHRFEGGRFVRLSSGHVKRSFIISRKSSAFYDLR